MQKNVKVTEKMIFRVYYFVGSHKMTTISIKKQNNDSTQLSSGYAFIVSDHLLLGHMHLITIACLHCLTNDSLTDSILSTLKT